MASLGVLQPALSPPCLLKSRIPWHDQYASELRNGEKSPLSLDSDWLTLVIFDKCANSGRKNDKDMA